MTNLAVEVISTGEMWTFWILGPLAVLAALGMVIARNAVHSALFLVLVMLCLGVFYVVQAGPFIGLAQIIVYTGAIMMLFLFVLMLVGRDAADSLIEVLRGQRIAAVLLGVGFAALVGTAFYRALRGVQATGLAEANQEGNVQGHRRLTVHPVRVRVRGHLGTADHGRGRRDDPGPHRAPQGTEAHPAGPDAGPVRARQLPGCQGRPGRLRHVQLGRHTRAGCPTAGSPSGACRRSCPSGSSPRSRPHPSGTEGR